VLVPGGWHGGRVWRPVAQRLRGAGHHAVTVTLPGLSDVDDVREITLCRMRLTTSPMRSSGRLSRKSCSSATVGPGTRSPLRRTGWVKTLSPRFFYYAAIVPVPGKGLIDECLPEHAAYFREAIDATCPVGREDP